MIKKIHSNPNRYVLIKSHKIIAGVQEHAGYYTCWKTQWIDGFSKQGAIDFLKTIAQQEKEKEEEIKRKEKIAERFKKGKIKHDIEEEEFYDVAKTIQTQKLEVEREQKEKSLKTLKNLVEKFSTK